MVLLRDMEPDDLPAVLDMWEAAWTPVVPEIDFKARRPEFAQHLATLAEGGARQRVAWLADELVGLLVIHPETGYLDQISVAPHLHGTGLALALIKDARAISPTGLSLTVNQINARAIRFYEREGFVQGKSDISLNSGLPIWHYAWSPN
ncbi:MAG: GNAT family N-acetyltransferase [Bosea sp. (in: a-proteobacteria)]